MYLLLFYFSDLSELFLRFSFSETLIISWGISVYRSNCTHERWGWHVLLLHSMPYSDSTRTSISSWMVVSSCHSCHCLHQLVRVSIREAILICLKLKMNNCRKKICTTNLCKLQDYPTLLLCSITQQRHSWLWAGPLWPLPLSNIAERDVAGWLAVACHQPSINAPSPSLLARGKCLTNPVFLCFRQILSFFLWQKSWDLFFLVVSIQVNWLIFGGKFAKFEILKNITRLKERETLDESV